MSALAPLTPASTLPLAELDAPAIPSSCLYYKTELRNAQASLRQERRRAASVETILLRHIDTLQRQVEDLRLLVFQDHVLKPTITIHEESEKRQ